MTYTKVHQILRQLGVNAPQISPDATLDNGLGMDSTEVVELRGLLKEAFDGFILPERWYRGKTVAELCALIDNNPRPARR